jgi:hypothetical protein
MRPYGGTREYQWALGGLSLFFVAITVVWLHLDRLPPTWDDGFYLTNSLTMFDSLVDGGLPGYARKFLSTWGGKPPLIALLPTPAYLILGRHAQFAYSVNLCFMLVLFVALFRLASKYAGPRVGLIAVYVAGTMPMLFGLSRWFLVEYAMAALVAVAVLCLAQSEILWFGIVCGLGLLLKASFPLYVVAPFLHWTITAWPRRLWLRTCLALAPAVLLPLPWYAINYRRAFQTAIEAGGHSLPQYGYASASSHFWRLVKEGPALYYATLVTLSIVTVALSRKAPDRKGSVTAVVWLAPFAFFVFGPFQEPRYTAALLPGFALLLALLLDAAGAAFGRWRNTATCALLAFPLIAMLQSSFGVFGSWDASSSRYTRKYNEYSWPQREILQRLGGTGKLLIASDTPHFNVNNFELAALELRSPVEVTTSAYEDNLEALLRQLDIAAFFVYKDGGSERGSWFFNKHGDALISEVKNQDFIEFPDHPRLPDGGVARIFRNPWPNELLRSGTFVPANLGQLTECQVIFGDQLQLIGFSVQQRAGGLEVKYRWRCLRPPDREYWCFTHVIDEQERIVGYLDHQILGGSPPMITWRKDDLAIERLRLRSAAIQEKAKYQLRMGLFHQPSGVRLPVRRASLPLTDRGTAVYLGTS